MWANAQRDGRPAATPQSLLTPTTRVPCSNASKTRNLQGCPKLTNRSQPLVGKSSLYYQDM